MDVSLQLSLGIQGLRDWFVAAAKTNAGTAMKIRYSEIRGRTVIKRRSGEYVVPTGRRSEYTYLMKERLRM